MADLTPERPNAEQSPLAYRVVRGGIWVALSSYWTIGFGFLVNIGLTRILPPEAFGRYQYAMFYVSLLSVSSKLGFRYAFAQFKETTDAVLGTYIGAEFVAMLGSLVLTLLALPILPASVAPLCLVMAVTAFAGLGSIVGVWFGKDLHLGRTSLVESIAIPVSYIPTFILAFQNAGAWSLVAQVVTQRLITSGAYLWLIRDRLPRLLSSVRQINPQAIKQFLTLGGTAGVTAFVSSLTVNLDNFLIGRFVGEATLGFYDRGRRMANWPSTLLTNMVSRTSLYTYAKLQDEKEKLRKALTMVTWILTMLSLPLALAIFFNAKDIVLLIYGAGWLPAVPYLRILVLVYAIWPLLENIGMLFFALGQPAIVLRASIVQVVIMAVVGLPATLAWGAIGTSMAAALASITKMGMMLWVTARRIPIKLSSILAPSLGAAIMTIGTQWIINRELIAGSLPLLIRITLIGGSSYAVFLCYSFLVQGKMLKERVVYAWRLFRQV